MNQATNQGTHVPSVLCSSTYAMLCYADGLRTREREGTTDREPVLSCVLSLLCLPSVVWVRYVHTHLPAYLTCAARLEQTDQRISHFSPTPPTPNTHAPSAFALLLVRSLPPPHPTVPHPLYGWLLVRMLLPGHSCTPLQQPRQAESDTTRRPGRKGAFSPSPLISSVPPSHTTHLTGFSKRVTVCVCVCVCVCERGPNTNGLNPECDS
mmetsp:Transcript_2211/g.5040  ORF Transcript_2211/g.5040 Transcript_2211/m.5040 type:complete len:209 (-) Transcript_2211:80-706(-)